MEGSRCGSLGRASPPIKDHRKEPHPYKSKYPETWQQELDKDVKTRHKSVCVEVMVQHIIDVCTEAYKGTAFADNWVFYHDALR